MTRHVPAGEAWPSASRRTGEVCSSRAGMCRDSANRNMQICATCVPVVMCTR